MATVPSAKVAIDSTAGAPGGGTDIVCVIAPSPANADAMPRQFGSADAAYAMHGFSRGIDYAGLHCDETGKPFIFCAVPIVTPGVVGRLDKSGHTGAASVTLSAGASGVLSSHDGVLRVKKGGTVGTDEIVLEYSLDNGLQFKTIRLGTGTGYTFPLVGVSVAFSTSTLVTGDTIATWHGTSPKCDAAGILAAFTNLANQLKLFRSVVLCSVLDTHTEAQAFLDSLNAYELSHDRYVYGRGFIKDRLPYSSMSHDVARMSAAGTLTFAEVGASGDTVTRSVGSWLTDGFAVGDTVTFAGTVSNNVTGPIASLSATVLTFGTTDLAAESISTATCVGYPTLTFAEVGASGDTITRNRGSFVDDGFRVGDKIVITGTASNNITAAQGLAAVTPTVITMGTDDLAVEVVGTNGVTVVAGQLKAAWMTASEAEFETIDGPTARRIDLGAGYGRKLAPFSGWNFRFPVAFAASLREYQHDVHIATWRKMDGNTGFDLFDDEGNLVEWDDRVDGGAASAARFTSFRTYGNGPGGAYITLSLTRDTDGSILSYTHNMSVVDVVQATVQSITENFIGRTPTLNDDGTLTDDERTQLESEVNSALELAVLTSKGEGPRASKAVWSASKTDVFNVPEALATGTVDLNLNGTIHSVATRVRVRSGGQ